MSSHELLQHLPVVLFLSLFVFLVGRTIYQTIAKGSFKAAMFGARIESTVGEVTSQTSNLVTVKIKVHRLDGDPDNLAVGLEVVATSFASYQMMPVTLSRADARQLMALLDQASAP